MEISLVGERTPMRRRKEAIQILQDPGRNGRNARQTMLMQKQARDNGEYLNFPDAEQPRAAVKDHDLNHLVAIYGDASPTPLPNGGLH